MSNHRKNGSFRAFLSRNGFYIALVVCVIAAAVASYSAVSNILDNLRSDDYAAQQPPATTTPPAATTQPDIGSIAEPEDPEPVREAPADKEDVAASSDPLVPIHTYPLSGTVIKGFSGDELVYSDTMQDWRTHNGIDFSADEGAEVYAVYSGEVTRAGLDPLLGYYLEQKLDSGYTVLYANLSPLTGLKAGDRLSQGNLIGYVGSSAILENGEPAHLHVEVRSGSKLIDPQSLFS
jgi:murein DD-endopeptidase MepM/ murein hydrolase activator NlpD